MEHFTPFHSCVTWQRLSLYVSACKLCLMHYAQLYCQRSCPQSTVHQPKVILPSRSSCAQAFTSGIHTLWPLRSILRRTQKCTRICSTRTSIFRIHSLLFCRPQRFCLSIILDASLITPQTPSHTETISSAFWSILVRASQKGWHISCIYLILM
jgi:hypothetical protein